MFNVARFRPLRDQMKSDKKVDDPNFAKLLRRSSSDLNLDDLAKNPDRVKNKKVKQGQRGDNSLVDLIARMQAGHVATPKASRGNNSLTIDWNDGR